MQAVPLHPLILPRMLLVISHLKELNVGFVFSLVTNNAVSKVGVRSTFLILGGIHLGICAFAIPLYVFGKRARAWTHRKAMMDWLYAK